MTDDIPISTLELWAGLTTLQEDIRDAIHRNFAPKKDGFVLIRLIDTQLELNNLRSKNKDLITYSNREIELIYKQLTEINDELGGSKHLKNIIERSQHETLTIKTKY